MARILVVTSGKGGVGKTTSSAAIATGLAQKGKKTVVIDFDIGLRNLDLIMGCERRVVYDFVNVIQGDATLNQALIKDKRTENLFILPASQTRDKDALTREGVEKVLNELGEMDFDFIICDSPAGIESGALMALYFADEAIITTNPEVSSVRDSDRILGILSSKSRRAEQGQEPIKEHLLLTRYNPGRVSRGDMLSMEDVLEILCIPLIGVIPEDCYYKDQSDVPMEERIKVNYDHPGSMDHELLLQHLKALKSGKSIQLPQYDYAEHTRKPESVLFSPKRVIILEGILLLTDKRLREQMDFSIFVDTPLDICLMRRIRRDVNERGRTLDSVIAQYNKTVRPMYLQFIEPTKQYADIIVPRGGKNRVAIDILKAKISQFCD